ncbi:uncharacterized protein BO88DRAFT_53380 [Aspergillus vadensis CBS 113365]|uniref:Uncharacterized protein n=1 Tax=Aspergillus vadensis (strain CBS 113365 / IMI 142717 / IBT 24658) TaxID=1448311 RepID=A0A319B8J2_ASPVC|nr:hypothetical protein BO88DRAFT_53380 [Aspergillus vadensis CBS 113365]PYH68875.1 hypothetical protein BO88DRAFT_53380 [Aspergillus vadensis CBS 113365]
MQCERAAMIHVTMRQRLITIVGLIPLFFSPTDFRLCSCLSVFVSIMTPISLSVCLSIYCHSLLTTHTHYPLLLAFARTGAPVTHSILLRLLSSSHTIP